MSNTYSRLPEEKLERFGAHYQQLLQRASSADLQERKRLVAILRRARKRAARLGVIVRERPRGKVQCFQRQSHQSLIKDSDFLYSKQIAAFIEQNDLYYGISNTNKPSWAIALNTYHLSETIATFLLRVMPGIIGEYAIACSDLIAQALSSSPDSIAGTLLAGVPVPVRHLWLRSLGRRQQLPFCFRPDLILDVSDRIRVIEFNVDSRLDRGIAHGVFCYSIGLLEPHVQRFPVNSLPAAYGRVVRGLAGARKPRVATLYNPECRAEYARQEDFFCRATSEAEGLSWRMLPIFQTHVDSSSGFLIESDTGKELDVVVLELELLGYNCDPRLDECNFIEKLLNECPNTHLLGSILPFADKLLLALVREGPSASQQLLSAFVPAWILGEETRFRVPVSLDDIRQCHKLQRHFVLKQTGIDLGTTGSKNVVISSDVTPNVWSRTVDQAMCDVQSGRRGWIVQPRIEPKLYGVDYRLTPQGQTRHDNCFVRLSGFYVMDSYGLDRSPVAMPTYSLAGMVATAGTDRQALRRRLYAIRGQRQSAYMTVTTSIGLSVT